MKRFKGYLQSLNESVELLEYLTPDQVKQYSKFKMSKKAREDTDHFFGAGNDRMEEDINDSHHDKSEPHKKVEQHIGRAISHDEYKSGLTTDKYGRQVRLSKLIKDPKVQQEFARDNTRSGVKAVKKPKMSIVRGTHVAGQTNSALDDNHPTGHSWGGESCKNVVNGKNRQYLPHEIKHGTVVCFAHDHDGKEIYRATLHPHHNEAGDTAYFVNSEYGIKNAAFTAHAHDVARRLSGSFKPGGFKIHPKVYDDNDDDTPKLHSNATAEHITDALKSRDEHIQRGAISHPNATAEHITDALKSKNMNVRFDAISHPKATAEHITTALKDSSPNVRWNAIDHPNVTAKHITTALKDKNEFVRQAAIRHPNATAEHITTALKDKDGNVRKAAVQHPNATAKHITDALKDEDEYVRIAAIRHPKATAEHITTALKDDNLDIRLASVQHPNATAEHITAALKDDHDYVHSVAIKHPNATAEHITNALKSKNPLLRRHAMRNPNATAEHITTALKDENEYVREAAIQHPNATAEHITTALKDKDLHIRKIAKLVADRGAQTPANKPKNTISMSGGGLKFNESFDIKGQRSGLERFKHYRRNTL